MKNLIAIITIGAIFTACGIQPTSTDELKAKRDSLQQVILDAKKQINNIELQIAKQDPSLAEDDLKTKKKIILQKNKLAAIEQQINALENTITKKEVDSHAIKVEVKEMKGESFNHYFQVFGNVEADEYGIISPEMGGKVEAIYVVEGENVKKGTLLLSLNTEALANQIKGVETNLEMAQTTFEKQKALWDQKIGSEIQYLQAKAGKEGLEAQLDALKSQLRMSQLRAPYDGTVNRIYPKKGEMASPGMPVIEFVNISNLTVKASVSEKYVGKVKVGQNVDLTFSSIPDYKISTPIVRVSKVIDSKSRTFEIEIKVKNTNEKIRPNMVSTILVNDYSVQDAFVIPSLAIRKDIAGSFIYLAVQKEKGYVVEKRKVESGLSYQDQSLITKGLNKADKVIVKGYSLVSNGMPVKVN